MANTQINIGANGTTTLATAGKYCDRNIDVNVAVPASGITPTGTKSITANGEHDVTNFAKANVNVPVPSGYIKPSGTATITANGTHDVTNYASASVNVPVPTVEIHKVVLSADKTSGDQTWVSNNTFVKNNYTKAGFAVLIVSATGTATGSVLQAFAYRGNRPYVTGGATVYGTLTRTSASGQGSMVSSAKITSTDYNGSPFVDANGNVKTATNNSKIKAGTYYIVLMLME